MAQYSGVNAVFDKSRKDRWTKNSNRLAVFTASLQCTDEIKVKENPQVSGAGGLGDIGTMLAFDMTSRFSLGSTRNRLY